MNVANQVAVHDMNARIIQIEQPVLRMDGRHQPGLQARGSDSPRNKSRVEQAFRMMQAWVHATPARDLYDLARTGR